MTLKEFTELLKEMDQRTGTGDAQCFECEVTQVSEKQFAFTYDALCRCQVVFEEDGTVKEYTETFDDDEMPEDGFFTFESVEDWKETSIKATNDWVV